MLNGRYIHLHQALGLGPLWLKRTARVHAGHKPAARAVKPTVTLKHTPEAVQTMIARMVADKTKITPTAHRRADKVDCTTTDIALRTVYTITTSANGVALWLTLRPRLNSTAGDIDKGDFGRLLQQLIRSSGHQPASWYSLPEREDDIVTACLNLLGEHGMRNLVFLGEEIDPALQLSRVMDGVRILSLPYPARLLRQNTLKKDTWQRIKHFFFEETP